MSKILERIEDKLFQKSLLSFGWKNSFYSWLHDVFCCVIDPDYRRDKPELDRLVKGLANHLLSSGTSTVD